jgi:hypothetical protein
MQGGYTPKIDKVIAETDGVVCGLEEKTGRTVVVGNGATAYIKNAMKLKPVKGDSSTNIGRSDFQSFNDWDSCTKTFIEDPASLLTKDTSTIQRRSDFERGDEVRYDVEGDFVDVGRFLDGEPEHFGIMSQGVDTPVFVQIIIVGSRSWRVPQQNVNAVCEALQNMVYALERNNFRCAITVFQVNECIFSENTIKTYREHLVPTDIAVATHNDRLRRIDFRYIENSGTFEEHYGSGVSTDEFVRRYISNDSRESDITIKIYGECGEHYPAQIQKTTEDIISGKIHNGVKDIS